MNGINESDFLDDFAEHPLIEGQDFYLEGGLMVLTTEYNVRRGYCCKNICRHCPYDDGGKLKQEHVHLLDD